MKTKNNTRGITSPSFEIYSKKPQQSARYGIGKGVGMHTAMEEKNVEGSETDQEKGVQLSLGKVKKTLNGKIYSSNKWCWDNWICICKKKKIKSILNPHLMP